MGYDEKMAERVRRFFSGRRDVVEKRMVGGLSFAVNGHMCCGITGDALMVRVGREAYECVVAQPHVRPMEFAGRRLTAFVCVEPVGYRTEAALAKWVQRGLDFVSTLPTKKLTTKTKRARKDEKPSVVDPDFARVIDAFAKDRQVSRGGKGFGSTGLKVNGKLFAMVSGAAGKFVAKLPKERVDALVRTGKGEHFDPGQGRLMKDWVAVDRAGADWVELAREARRFVGRGRHK